MESFHTGLSALVARHAHQLPCDALMSAVTSLVSSVESPQLEISLKSPPAATRFSDLDDSLLDRTTNLIWTKQTLSVGKVDFKGAEKAVADLVLDGVRGWRLPTIRELLTLVDYERHDPAISPEFECKADWYWTSTPAAHSPAGCAWIVNSYYGNASWIDRDSHAFVRAVRPSQ